MYEWRPHKKNEMQGQVRQLGLDATVTKASLCPILLICLMSPKKRKKKNFLWNTNRKDRFEKIETQNIRIKDTDKRDLGDDK